MGSGVVNKKLSAKGVFNLYIFSLVFLSISTFFLMKEHGEGRPFMGLVIYGNTPVIIGGILLGVMFVFSAYLVKLSHRENKSNFMRVLFIGLSGFVLLFPWATYILSFTLLQFTGIIYFIPLVFSVLFIPFSIIIWWLFSISSYSDRFYLAINFLTSILSIAIMFFGMFAYPFLFR